MCSARKRLAYTESSFASDAFFSRASNRRIPRRYFSDPYGVNVVWAVYRNGSRFATICYDDREEITAEPNVPIPIKDYTFSCRTLRSDIWYDIFCRNIFYNRFPRISFSNGKQRGEKLSLRYDYVFFPSKK